MKTVRTFYWHDRVKGPLKLFIRRRIQRKPAAWREFAVGNAGDIFARNLVQHFYAGATALNTDAGPRLLGVGSIAHKMQPGDILCGIGSKGVPFPDIDPGSVLIHALRGPLTERYLTQAGYDTSKIQWFGDPGLTIASMLPPRQPKPGRVIFIPHYRELQQVRKVLPQGVQIVQIDADPFHVGRQIQRAELVYSSSLHGIVFAHALGRPVVMVKPATEEPLSKFHDYHLGVGLAEPVPLDSIEEVDFKTAPTSPATLSVSPDDIVFPPAELLQERDILT